MNEHNISNGWQTVAAIILVILLAWFAIKQVTPQPVEVHPTSGMSGLESGAWPN